jgi:hypothetical protein
MEPISPELALVDPELARRARALLPEPAVDGERELPPVAAPIPAKRPRSRGDRLVRVAAWLAVPSIALNIAYMRADARSDSMPTVAPSPTATALSAGPAPDRADVRPRSRQHAKVKRPVNAAVAAAEFHKGRAPAAAAPVRWPAHGNAAAFDLILWRGHRRVADIWTKRRDMTIAELACGAKSGLAPGRYLWFVYPVVDARAGRYGRLLKWGKVDVRKHVGCRARAAGR